MKVADPNSKRSKRRKNRNFVDLLTSTRKHKRAYRRQMASRIIFGKVMKIGEKDEPSLNGGKLKVFLHTGSGKFDYHC